MDRDRVTLWTSPVRMWTVYLGKADTTEAKALHYLTEAVRQPDSPRATLYTAVAVSIIRKRHR